MGIPDLPAPSEISGESRDGLKYRVLGTVQQVLTVELGPDRAVYSDAGAMSWMMGGALMSAKSSGGLGGMLKRAVSGASAFIIDFTAQSGPGQVAFSTDFPGKIMPIELEEGQFAVMHKHAFLCAEKTVSLDLYFTKKLSAGMFGGEGFILQKLSGPGMVFAELDGDAVEYRLGPGETLQVEPGHIAMFEGTVSFDVQMVKGIANILFGGEGLFLGILSGPGRVWLHSMTASKMAHRIGEYLPSKG